MKQAPFGIRKQPSDGAAAVDFTRDSEILQVFPSGSLLSSQPGQWNGVHLSYYQHRPHELPETVSHQHLVLVHLAVPTWAEQRLDTQFQENQFQVGDILIVPAQMSHYACWDTEHRYLILSINPTVLRNAVMSTGSCNKAELIPHFATADPLVHGIGLALKAELESNSLGGQLYADSLCSALLNHLIRHYTAQKPTLSAKAGGLSGYQLRQVLEYIDAYLYRKLALADLAAIAQMSPSYFTQRFKESTGYTPHQYVIQHRVKRARQLLVEGKLAITDVALQVGFAHQSHLNRHFKRWLGVTPKTFLNSL
ncbi:AraC family transcriptional regulator [cf. Phormidesmis sp. LEGE 11477]|uniref:AraC family transcriptional regulator n=1 Tax=cf. Phormidesmis sp. LEGE 11477 TaxID=1828680 RepID=UPI001882C5C7|nr:AraC family transcriptional regulator [cf. Phormidesmis sp. LEGE 11477]MBE9062460.1 helix-turn-helix transcriptional regulator [cf. Phormidesmis sp. LEGE 11477]